MGTQNIATLTLTKAASGVIAANRAVTFAGAQASVQGEKIMGVARAPAAAIGDLVPVDVAGTVVMEAGAAIAIGDAIIVDNVGRAIASTGALAVAAGAVAVTSSAANGAILTGGDGPEYVLGDALDAAAAAGALIEILLRR